MADADWYQFRQLRGQPLPVEVALKAGKYRLCLLFKQDFYAATGLYERAGASGPERILFKQYHTDAWGPLPLGWLGRYLCYRETWFARRLSDVPGVPALLERHGSAGFAREYVEGCHLREHYNQHGPPGAAFFPALEITCAEIHRRRVAHNDLSKPENILVATDGRPFIIDFQIALATNRWPLVDRLVRYLQTVDRYHLKKLHRRVRPQDLSPAEIAASRKQSLLVRLHAYLRRPYRAIRHLVLESFLRQVATPAEAPATATGRRL